MKQIIEDGFNLGFKGVLFTDLKIKRIGMKVILRLFGEVCAGSALTVIFNHLVHVFSAMFVITAKT